MEKYTISGGKPLTGTVKASGAKNVAVKVVIAALLTTEEVVLHNMPKIVDLEILLEIIETLGAKVTYEWPTIRINASSLSTYEIPLEAGARIRTSSMLIAPLLARFKEAHIPNPGGCRIGARPIDRTIKGLEALGAQIGYASEDGYFHARTEGLRGNTYHFTKTSHTGTETLIIAAATANGKTIIQNAAQEVEIDDLIALINKMGGNVKRVGNNIEIIGVEKLSGTELTISPDRNEVVTFAIAAYVTGGDITVEGAVEKDITVFLDCLTRIHASWERTESGLRFWKSELVATDVTTGVHPGFMTDWQAPWAVLMTQAKGESIIHETVYENRFNYVDELSKMGAKITLFNPPVDNPEEIYQFNWNTKDTEKFHAVKIIGPTKLHNAVMTVADLRAGATLVIAALSASGKSVIYGIDQIDRGYEHFEDRLRSLGATIERSGNKI